LVKEVKDEFVSEIDVDKLLADDAEKTRKENPRSPDAFDSGSGSPGEHVTSNYPIFQEMTPVFAFGIDYLLNPSK